MKHETIDRAVRDWVLTNPARGARDLARLASEDDISPARSAEEIAEALIEIAGRIEIAHTRIW